MSETAVKKAIGGAFVVQQTTPDQIFIPEDFTEEQKMIGSTCEDFLEKEIYPKLDEIDSQKDPGLMPSLMDKAGELGLLGTSVPDVYGGFGMDFNTSMLVAEVIGAGHSFAVALSAHTGIGTLPIAYYGNDEQKAKYLPKLATGEWKASYCLTEPDSGSDANSGKTKAVLSADGKQYLITGQKMWITNGGFADIFIVFAKIEQDKNLTAFIIEKSFGGITMNEEEHKMGIKGSSTRQIFFNDCPVPAENMLSTRENGFKIAVNILNIGRIKLAAAAIGASKRVAAMSRQYATERKQFGVSIGTFGAIQFKMAEQYIKVYASESATYRAGQDIENKQHELMAAGMDDVQAKLKGVENYAIECAILKVHASETLDYVTDEGVQIYGGMGYSADAPMERAYRDSRINRIFEGTNEINRLLAVGTLLKKAMKGEIDLIGPAMKVQQEIMSIPDFGAGADEGFMAAEVKKLAQLKKAFLMVSGAAVQKLMMRIEEEQEIMMFLADILIEIYVAESTLLRTMKLASQKGESAVNLEKNATILYLHLATEKIAFSARQALQSFATGDELKMMMMGLKRFTKQEPVNVTQLRREIVKALSV
ncbi:MAG TPA: acyl-CoA dehydrogenase family protein [Catalimonadaceae bacterium]|nr:acyl-CoA dehydrogenase family protein [Catalimonadaceae bacterium]HPI12556.1 acyl-CoA dehydrogenase family protein [Catalimonadaceae bacterium]